ncbi:PREDICTED: uncharacterized protein LOC109148652 [Ipomoea nil]|uniref:uncharacterized protein LOC109148652 n=1 Tax=Ipomoea nil TaxID=35883 RepID=UPI000901643E|nr:PREDICTED: uncharacterized protein LOC109148652 [Ipomoea nil]
MTDCKPLSTLIPLSKSLSHTTDLYDDPTQYWCLAGVLQYLTITRPNLSLAINQLCQHMHAPTITYWEQIKHVLRYVKETLSYGLRIRKSESRELHAFSDSDWAGCPEDRKSTSGYAVFLGSNLVYWVCMKQRTVARSSIEVEYKGLADVCAEVIWVLSLLREIGVTAISVPKLWCVNLGATYLCANPVFHARTKHVQINYHFVRDRVAKGEIQVNFISTKDQLADARTKHVEIDYHFVRDRVAKGEIQVNFISTKDQLANIFTKALVGLRFSFLRDNAIYWSRMYPVLDGSIKTLYI